MRKFMENVNYWKKINGVLYKVAIREIHFYLLDIKSARMANIAAIVQ